jgi:hypothetical protein
VREASRPEDGEQKLQLALRRLAAETHPQRPLPSAGQLWWRAEVVRRLIGKPDEEVKRSLRPAVWGERAGVVGGLAILLGYLSLQAPSILELFGRRIALGDFLPLALLGMVPLLAASVVGFLVAWRN